MTLPTTYSWFPRGHRLRIPYQASEGRRVNAIGAYITHGPGAGRLLSRTWASLPKSRAKRRRTSVDERAAAYGLTADEVGPIDSERLVTFIWEVAGRPRGAPSNWQRERPLMLVLDNYSVHKSQVVATARPTLEAANIYLVYLPSYCPELSLIEPVWNDVKQHHLPTRSFVEVSDLKRAVDDALASKARHLWDAHFKTANFDRLST